MAVRRQGLKKRLAGHMGPLGERNYRLLFVGQASSFVGDGMVPVAISFAVLRLTGSVGDVGLALTARYAPLRPRSSSRSARCSPEGR